MVKKYFIFMLFMFSAQLTSAILEVQIDVPENFSYGEDILYEYSFFPYADMNISYIANVLCEDETAGLLKLENISLKKRELFSSNFYLGNVDDFSNIVDCRAIVMITNPIKANFEKPFKIISKKTFVVELRSCGDEFCLKKDSSFIKGEKIYLDYYTSSENVSLSNIQLKFPSSNSKFITLPYNFTTSEIGIYELTTDATKKDYRDTEIFHIFSVIEKEPEIQLLNFSNYPIDEPPEEKLTRQSGLNLKKDYEESVSGKFSLLFWFAVLIFIAFILAIIVLLIHFKRKNNSN